MDRFTEDLEQRAARVLPEPVHRYFRQGSRYGVSVGEATAAWDRFRFLPQVLRDVTEVDLGIELLGTSYSTPFGIAPTTLQRAAHPEGELATARAAAACGAPLVVSSNAGSTFADIAETGASWWLQMYVTADRPSCEPVLQSAVKAGATAVVLTADTPVVGTKYDSGPTVWDVADPSWLRANFPSEHGEPTAEAKATDLGPHDVHWLAEATGLPVVVKGVLRADDARRCVDAGASAVWVSNHGGRQLDGTATTADCLSAVVEEVGQEAEVYVDGGVRTSRHALVALALGARAVFLGRPVLYALALEGEAGVSRLLLELAGDLEEDLRLAGCPATTSVSRDLLRRLTPADRL